MSESVQAVDRASDILLCLSTQTTELTMTQIAERVGIHKSIIGQMLPSFVTASGKASLGFMPEKLVQRILISWLSV